MAGVLIFPVEINNKIGVPIRSSLLKCQNSASRVSPAIKDDLKLNMLGHISYGFRILETHSVPFGFWQKFVVTIPVVFCSPEEKDQEFNFTNFQLIQHLMTHVILYNILCYYIVSLHSSCGRILNLRIFWMYHNFQRFKNKVRNE